MRALAKTAVALAIVAAAMVVASSAVLRAQGIVRTDLPVDRTLTTETRTITAAVTKIELSGPIDLTVRQGTTASLTVYGEKRLLANVATVQDGAALRIETTGSMPHLRRPIRIELTVPALASLSNTGSGDVRASGFSGEQLELALRGSGEMTLDGQYKRVTAALNGSGDLRLDTGRSDSVDLTLAGSGDLKASGTTTVLNAQIRGSGDMDARQLSADSATVNLYGSGDVEVNVKQKIAASIVGSGDIQVRGNPPVRSVSQTGSGEVLWH